MERVGVLVVSYGSRGASFVDAFTRSNYDVELYIADKQKNPFNVERAKEHVVVPKLDINEILNFAKKYKEKIDFGIVGSEGPIICGIRDLLEKEADIPMICPTKEFALEESKVLQRDLLNECCPDNNPGFKVFEPGKSMADIKKDLWDWLDEVGNAVAVKPDKPGYGKGVGVWGDHFTTRDELFEHFMSIYEHGTVLVEEKIDGQESSFQCFCDGKNIVPFPDTRDYKRAFVNDEGPNTGGMGSYKDSEDYLPFMSSGDKERENQIVEKIFKKLRGNGSNPGLMGIPLYVAFIHTAAEPQILEINSRPGDPEIMNIMPIIKDDFVDVCFKMLDGTLSKINFEKKATVVTYKVPSGYGGFDEKYPGRVNTTEVGGPVDMAKAYGLVDDHGGSLRVYPGSMELRDGKTYSLSSRAVACVGVGDTIEAAREISLEGVRAISGGSLWYREDLASKEHIAKSQEHMKALRGN